MSKQTEALKLALDWIEGNGKYDAAKRIAQTIREALAEHPAIKQELTPEQPAQHQCKFPMCQSEEYQQVLAEQIKRELYTGETAQPQQEGFASPGGGYVPAIPRPMPLDWKLVPRKATPEMLKAMDECAQEGYDERLYAGMASSVYMAAWDASPVMGTLPEQPAQQQEPMAYSYTSRITGAQGFSHHPMPRFIDADSWDIKPLYTKDQL